MTEKDDFALLVDLYMFYHRSLLAVGGFVATAQAAIVAIGGGRITDRAQIQAVAAAVLVVAICAVVFYALSLRRLREFDRCIKDAQHETGRSWRPRSEMLSHLAVGFLALNSASLIAAVTAIVCPTFFEAPR